MKIRLGSLAECVAVVEQIPEFAHKETQASLSARLSDKQDVLVLLAEHQGELVGFKIGYALDSHRYYSWFGGVSPQGRRLGVAQALLEAQEREVVGKGFKRLEVKSRNRFTGMLCLLLKNGYLIENIDKYEDSLESRIRFGKQFEN